MVYAIAFFLVVLGTITNARIASNTRKFMVAVICGYVILLFGFRYRVGIDTINYMSAYSAIPSWQNFINLDFFQTRFEPGYLLICVICKSIMSDFWLIQIVMSAITNIGIFIFLYRYSKNPFVGILIYFVIACPYFSTEIMRESAAIAIFLLNYENLKNKKWIRFYLISFISISFHYSAIIVWLFPLVRYIKKVNVIYILMVCCLLAIMPLAESLNRMLTIASIASRVDQYVDSAETLNLNWRLAELIKSAILPIAGLYIAKKAHLEFSFKPYMLLKILLCAGAFSIPIIFSRISNYATIFICVYIANILSEKSVTTVSRSWLCVILLLSQCHYYYKMYNAWSPYVSIWDGTKSPAREHLWWEYNH